MHRLDEIPAYARLELDVVGAEGNDLLLADGSRVLDLYGGHCVNSLGAGDAELGRALAAQWQRLSFCTNLLESGVRPGFQQAFEQNLPPGEWNVFVTNSGAEANENALKLALDVTNARGKRGVVVFHGAFHGRTAAATAASDSKKPQFPRAPFEIERAPWGDLDAVERALEGGAGVCFLEPIQSLAGVVDPPAGFLESLRARCDAHGALLVYDEVQTGNGRLGSFWASQHFGVVPDLFTTAKGAGGGFPIGLTVAARSVCDAADPKLCGSTFGGGPLALTAARVVAERLATPGFLDNVRATSAVFKEAAELSLVQRVRGAGLLLGFELEPAKTAAAVRDELLTMGFLAGTSGNPHVLRVSPALTLTPADARRFVDALATLASTAPVSQESNGASR